MCDGVMVRGRLTFGHLVLAELMHLNFYVLQHAYVWLRIAPVWGCNM